MKTNRSEHVANVTLAQAARIASRPAYLTPSTRVAKAVEACAPGAPVGEFLRLAGFVVLVFVATWVGGGL